MTAEYADFDLFIQYLLNRHTRVWMSDSDELTRTLLCAAFSGHVAVVRLLLERGLI